MKRKSHCKAFKAKVAIEALKGQKTVNEITSEYGVHVNQNKSWKKRLLEAGPEILSRGRDHEAAAGSRAGSAVSEDWSAAGGSGLAKKKTGHLG